ncbi:MAG: glycoside hydrolase family 3 C-terminal domain-containing protein, partial [Blautia sp.]|nr:glycoside hydrolase family 3 C-terminal domain-containing protein [Blautia sp.]
MNKNVWRGLTSVMAFLLVIACLGSSVAMAYDGAINSFLGVKTVELINTGEGNEDTQYFSSAYGDFTEENLKALVEDSFEQTINEMLEGAALLKNDNNALPLDKATERISFFGHACVDPIYKGNSAGVDPMEGYRINFPTAFRMDGYTLNEELVEALSASPTTRAKNNYFWMDCTNATQGIADGEDPIDFYTPELRATWEGEKGGTAIMVLTRCGQENYDMLTNNRAGFVKGEGMFDPPLHEGTPTGLSSLALIQEERDILEMIKEAKSAGYFDKIVVLLNTGNTMEVGWLEEYDVDACVYTGLLGGVGAHAVAKLLAGEANFSGRIVDTYAVDSLSSPAVVNANGNTQTYQNGDEVEAAVLGTISPFADTGRWMNFQAEGIYVGYKYYETRYEDCVLDQGNASGAAGASNGETSWDYTKEVSYPFGFGLSYTTFQENLEGVTYNEERDVYEVTVTVTNTGDMAGKRTVQIYAQTPYGEYERKNKVEKSA